MFWSITIILTGLTLFPILLYIDAPYGKFYRSGFGWSINGKLAWFLFESIPWIIFLQTNATGVELYFVFCWMVHYLHRSIIYTIRAPSMKHNALIAVIGAILFNMINGYNHLSIIRHGYSKEWMYDVRFWIGSVLFWLGMVINITADNTLFRLKKQSDKYEIPRGGLYEYISCPNYFGEILEWFGWALMTWALPAFAFLIFTICNLVPRAIKTHEWYTQKFENYPKRNILIPL